MYSLINFNTLLIIKMKIYIKCQERKKIQCEQYVLTNDNDSLLDFMNEFTKMSSL